MIAAVMTCRRPDGKQAEYLAATLRSLKEAGILQPMMVSDGEVREEIKRLDELPFLDDECWIRTQAIHGIVPTFREAVAEATWAIANQRVAVFQDDIEPSSRMMTFSFTTEDGTDIHQRMRPSESLAVIVEKCLPANRGVFSLYLSEGREAPQGWSTIDKSDEYPLNVGACGIVMDAETARLFIESPPFPRVDRLGSQLVLWCWEKGIPFFVHSPSLLKHTGAISCR